MWKLLIGGLGMYSGKATCTMQPRLPCVPIAGDVSPCRQRYSVPNLEYANSSTGDQRGNPSQRARRKQITVFLLDDHEVVRRGVRDMLEAEGDITVIGEAGTASSALARIPALRPDVAVLDVRLPDGDGVSVCRDIRSRMPEVACLMLTSF